HPERVAQGMEHVAVGKASGVGEQRVPLPADGPREERGVARVHHAEAQGQGVREDDGEDGEEPRGDEQARAAHYCSSDEWTQPVTPAYVTFTQSPLTAWRATRTPAGTRPTIGSARAGALPGPAAPRTT